MSSGVRGHAPLTNGLATFTVWLVASLGAMAAGREGRDLRPEPVLIPSEDPASAPYFASQISDLTPVAAGAVFVVSGQSRDLEIWGLATGEAEAHLLSETGPPRFGTPGQWTLRVHRGLAFWQSLGQPTAESEASIWRTDGTQDGTFAMRFPGHGNLVLGPSVRGGLLFAGGPRAALGLYRTDGTQQGTRFLRAFPPSRSGPGVWIPGVHNPPPVRFIGGSGRAYVAVQDNSGDYALMLSDGTSAGTGVLLGFGEMPPPGAALSGQVGLTFTVDRGQQLELWSTGIGHVAPRPIQTIPGRLDSREMVEAGGKVCFRVRAAPGQLEIWCTDGSGEGTRPVALLAPDESARSRPTLDILLPVAGRWVFSAATPESGNELWASTVDPLRPIRLTDLCQGPCDGIDAESQAFERDGLVLFHGGEEGDSHLWWATDGTERGTRRLFGGDLDGPKGVTSARPIGAGLAFLAQDDRFGTQLWWTAGTAERTLRLTRFSHQSGFRTDGELELAEIGGRWLFVANDPARGVHLWSAQRLQPKEAHCHTCGVAAPAGLPVMFLPGREDCPLFATREGVLWTESQLGASHQLWAVGSRGSVSRLEAPQLMNPRLLRSQGAGPTHRGSAFFLTAGGESESWLWQTDGTVAGTRPRAALRATPDEVKPVLLAAKERFVLLGRSGGQATIWSVPSAPGANPTAAPTVQVGQALTAVETVIGDLLYFTVAALGPTGVSLRLWRTDGTVEGTFPLLEGGPMPLQIEEWQGRAVFARMSVEGRQELWTSDGTVVGTRTLDLKEIGPDVGYVSRLISAASRLFLIAGTENRAQPGRADLFQIGRLTEPARKVNDQPLWLGGFAAGRQPAMSALGSLLIFAGQQGAEGLEPWVSDGTLEGTRLLADAAPGEAGSDPRDLVALAGRMFFTADDGVHGRELWVSDGTPRGTRRVADLSPGLRSSRPRCLTASGDTLFFLADDGRQGLQLYRLRP